MSLPRLVSALVTFASHRRPPFLERFFYVAFTTVKQDVAIKPSMPISHHRGGFSPALRREI